MRAVRWRGVHAQPADNKRARMPPVDVPATSDMWSSSSGYFVCRRSRMRAVNTPRRPPPSSDKIQKGFSGGAFGRESPRENGMGVTRARVTVQSARAHDHRCKHEVRVAEVDDSRMCTGICTHAHNLTKSCMNLHVHVCV